MKTSNFIRVYEYNDIILLLVNVLCRRTMLKKINGDKCKQERGGERYLFACVCFNIGFVLCDYKLFLTLKLHFLLDEESSYYVRRMTMLKYSLQLMLKKQDEV